MTERIKRAAKLYPDRVFYTVRSKSITYSEAFEKAEKYSLLLKKQGSSPVIIYGHKDISVIVSILACVIAGRTYVPVDLSSPVYRLEQIIEMTGSSLVISDEKLNFDSAECLSPGELEKFRNEPVKEQTGDTVYIIFTSGSTGTPKGVPISRENLCNFIDWISGIYPLCEYENIRVLNQASFSFDLSVADFYYSLCNGHTLVALDGNMQEDFDSLFEVIKTVDVAVMTPTFMKMCLLNEEFNEKNFPLFKCVYFCGEQLEVKTAQKIFRAFPNLKVINAYGPTEAASAVSAILITPQMAQNNKILPVGEVGSFATDIEINDGEIVLKGKSVFGGYLGSVTGGYFKEGSVNCFRTGDMGCIENGLLYCKGRTDSQIKFKGYRIELTEIEYNINLIDGVKECAVIAKYNGENAVKTVKAFVVADEGITAEYIKDELKKHLPEYMTPKTVKLMDSLPVNANGKTDRKALGEL